MDNRIVRVVVVLLTAITSCYSRPPNIVLILIDDLGWSDVGYQNIAPIVTPNIDKLAAQGVILDNYYVQPICTPTRSALMTGKYPIHTGMQHGVIFPAQPYGLPTDLTLLPQKLKKAGYATHMVGKWHLGYFEWQYTPLYRGFDTHYGYYNGAEDYWTHKVYDLLDLRDQKSPVTNMTNVYSANMFSKRAEQIIAKHNTSVPLFLYLPFQNVHAPNEAPESFIKKYDFIKDQKRRIYAGMVSVVDEAIGNVTNALRNKGLLDNTLIVVSTDNGGKPISGGYNWPLRGCKTTLWEGGVRGIGFVYGSMIEKKARRCKELLHVTDWFPTLMSLAGLKDTDDTLDGYNVWNTISKDEPSPRTEILHNIDMTEQGLLPWIFDGIALRVGDMKLIMNVTNFPWFKPPELSTDNHENDGESMGLIEDVLKAKDKNVLLQDHRKFEVAGFFIKEALFNITADPEERHDLSSKFPDIVTKLKERVDFYKKGVVKIRNQPADLEAWATAKRDGAWGPWRGQEEPDSTY